MTQKRFAVIGTKTEHSKSPVFQNTWLKAYGLADKYAYVALNVAENALASFLHTLHKEGFCGLNVTVPHKENVYRFMEHHFPLGLKGDAERMGAVNTIIVRENGELEADNTDAYGFTENITQTLSSRSLTWDFAGKSVVIIGAGGATRAVIVGLQKAGVQHIILSNRTETKATQLATELGGNLHVVPWEERHAVLERADMLINATTQGMVGTEPLHLRLDALPLSAIVTDIVYNPLITPLLAQAEARGNPIVDGLGMLLYQGQRSFYLWHHILPEVTADIRKAVLA